MLRIGDFSRFGQVSVKTLHHYDEVGLLRPASVDRQTGYRYYEADQLQQLSRIVSLKELGFALEEIAEVMKRDLTTERLCEMLCLRKKELQQRIRADRARIVQVDMWLKQIEEEQRMPKFDIMSKTIEPQLVASIRQLVPNVDVLAPFFPEIEEYVQAKGSTVSGPGMIIYNDEEHCDEGKDMEAAYPIGSTLPDTDRIRIYEIPRIEVAYLVYTGAYEDVAEAHKALGEWIVERGYHLAGANRVVFLQCGEDAGGAADEETVVEIQYTVKK